MTDGVENPEWWDRYLDWVGERYVSPAAFYLVLLWSFLVVLSLQRSAALALAAVLSLPIVLIALVYGSRKATAAEREAFARSFSDDPEVARASEAEWRQLHAHRDAQLSPLRRFSWLIKPPRVSLRSMAILMSVNMLLGLLVSVFSAFR